MKDKQKHGAIGETLLYSLYMDSADTSRNNSQSEASSQPQPAAGTDPLMIKTENETECWPLSSDNLISNDTSVSGDARVSESRKRPGTPSANSEHSEKRARGEQNEEHNASTNVAPAAHTNGAQSQTTSPIYEAIESNPQADKLDLYVWEYLQRRNYKQSAAALVSDSGLPEQPEVPIRTPQGLLFEYWNVFWELFSSRVGHGVRQASAYEEFLELRRSQHASNFRRNSLNAMVSPEAATSAAAAPATPSTSSAPPPEVATMLGPDATLMQPPNLPATMTTGAAVPSAVDVPQALPPASPISTMPGQQGTPQMQSMHTAAMPSPVPTATPATASAVSAAAASPMPSQTPSASQPTPQMRQQNASQPTAGLPFAQMQQLQQMQQMQLKPGQTPQQLLQMHALARAQPGQNWNVNALTPQQQQNLLISAALRQGIPLEELKNMAPAQRIALLSNVMPAQNQLMDPQVQARLLLQQQQQQQMLQMQQQLQGKGIAPNTAAFQALFNRPQPPASAQLKQGAGDEPAQRGMMPQGMPQTQQFTPQQRQMLLMQYQTLQGAVKSEWLKAQNTPVPAMSQQFLANAQQLQAKAQSIVTLLQSGANGDASGMAQQQQQQQTPAGAQPPGMLNHQQLQQKMNGLLGQSNAQRGPFGELDVAANPYLSQQMANTSLALQQQRLRVQTQNGQPHQGVESPQTPAVMNGMLSQNRTGVSATAPSTPVTGHTTPVSGKAPRMGASQRAGSVQAPTHSNAEMPPSPWQPPASTESPIGPTGKKERGRRPGRPPGKSQHHQQQQQQQRTSVDTKDNVEDKSATNAVRGTQPLQMLQQQSVFDMPSLMDDMPNGLGIADSGTMTTGSGGTGGTDDFSAMFGVSDIFDFDFDGGSENTGGLFNAPPAGAGADKESSAPQDAHVET